MCPSDRPTDPLTPRETEVLRCIAAGLTNDAIAAELVIANPTAKSHVERVLRKLGADNRAHAVAFGFCLGVLDTSHDPCPARGD